MRSYAGSPVDLLYVSLYLHAYNASSLYLETFINPRRCIANGPIGKVKLAAHILRGITETFTREDISGLKLISPADRIAHQTLARDNFALVLHVVCRAEADAIVQAGCCPIYRRRYAMAVLQRVATYLAEGHRSADIDGVQRIVRRRAVPQKCLVWPNDLCSSYTRRACRGAG